MQPTVYLISLVHFHSRHNIRSCSVKVGKPSWIPSTLLMESKVERERRRMKTYKAIKRDLVIEKDITGQAIPIPIP